MRCNLEANKFKSSHLCQPLFEGNFTITPDWVTRPNCRSGMTTVFIITVAFKGICHILDQ